MMKAVAAVLIVLALASAVVPALTNCFAQGRTLTLQDGRTTPMKCYWTARAELALAVPLAAVGVLMAFSRRRESQRQLGAMAGMLGICIALIPTLLIGVCQSSDMLCNSVMRPSLVLLGTLALFAGISTVGLAIRTPQPA